MSCVTTDYGVNIVNVITNLDWPWLSCFGHNLNVAVNNAIKKEKAKTDHCMPLYCHCIHQMHFPIVGRGDGTAGTGG